MQDEKLLKNGGMKISNSEVISCQSIEMSHKFFTCMVIAGVCLLFINILFLGHFFYFHCVMCSRKNVNFVCFVYVC